MKTILNFVRILFVLGLLFSPTSAFAGTVQLPQTGQTRCYDEPTCAGTGQDGDIQAGVAWPNPRFKDNGDQTVTDKLTGLIWTKDGNVMATRDPGFDSDSTFSTAGDGRVTWQHALDYIKKLNQENYLGHNDWRLPNRTELKSIVNIGQSPNANWMISNGFTNIQENYYWSSSTCAYQRDYAWIVDMRMGEVGSSSKSRYEVYPYYVWPVRSEQSSSKGSSIISLPQTGQTTCYDATGSIITCAGTGQDGDIQAGVAWPNPRFKDNGDQTVTDKLTGLIWTKDGNVMATRDPDFRISPDAGSVHWQDALDYIKKLNQENYLGHNDWRLPNRTELESLMDIGQSSTNNWLIENGFTNILSNAYWSSSTLAWHSDEAWIVSIGGFVYSFYKVSKHYYNVWPVRSGQSGALASLLISKSGNGTGTVTSIPAGINCASQCSASFAPGTSVTLAAQAVPGSIFAGWSGGGCQGTETCTVTLNSNTTVTATFTVTSVPLLANTGPNQVVFDKVTLDGSTSQGNIISWNWTLTHQTNSAYNRTVTGQKPNLGNLEPGFYDVLLTVSDGTTTNSATSILAVAGPWDVNGDGKLGLAEIIFILQTTAGTR